MANKVAKDGEEDPTPASIPQGREAEEEELTSQEVDALLEQIAKGAQGDALKPAGEGDNADAPVQPADSKPTFDPAVLDTPEAQAALARSIATALAAKDQDASQAQAAAEITELINAGKFDELGQRWAQSMQEKEIGSKTLNTFLSGFYQKVFGQEVFQSLTPEERQEIDPRSHPEFRDDAEYLVYLSNFMAKKGRDSTFEERIEEAVTTRIEAMRRGKAGEKARKGAVAGAEPAASSAQPRPSEARAKISEGLRETYGDSFE